MNYEIILATNNKHKLKEVREILTPEGIIVYGLSDLGLVPEDVDENGSTYYENALIKAKAVQKLTILPIISDDSGIEITALNNEPGIYSARYAKKDSKEEIVIWLTSNFTNNKVYKIAYETGITNINKGSGEKIAYLRSVKVYEFWRRINQKYGTPDNKEDILWGLGENKPYMKAATGRLLLEDPMLRELDYTRMSREDQKFMNTNLYNF